MENLKKISPFQHIVSLKLIDLSRSHFDHLFTLASSFADCY
jgi:hypothetical protein